VLILLLIIFTGIHVAKIKSHLEHTGLIIHLNSPV
jgi:hypothetical protein